MGILLVDDALRTVWLETSIGVPHLKFLVQSYISYLSATKPPSVTFYRPWGYRGLNWERVQKCTTEIRDQPTKRHNHEAGH
jgi:hypothetical protein